LPPTWDDDIKVVSAQIQGSPLADPTPEAVIVESDPAACEPAPTLAPAPKHKHNINWQAGLAIGLKAAEGVAKIVDAFQDQESTKQQVVLQETIYNNGSETRTVETWQSS
jgi:hypothetical protein